MSNNKTIPELGIMQMITNYQHINENLIYYFNHILEEHDGLVKMKLPYSLILTNHSEFVNHVFRKNNKNYIISKLVRETFREEVAAGLPTIAGKPWLKQRRAMQPGFHKKKLEGTVNLMIEEANLYIETVLDKYAENQQEVDLFSEMLMLTFRLIIKILFGKTFNEEKMLLFRESIEFGLQTFINKTRKPYLKPWYRINGLHAKNKQLQKTRDKYVSDFIQKRRDSGKQEDDLLDMLLNVQYEDGSSMTNKQLLEEVILLFVAGHETSGNGVAWILFILDKYPEIAQKMIDYIDEHLGDRTPTLEDLSNMSYITQVIEEGLRLYPPAWYIEREALGDDNIEGVSITKGQTIAISIYSLHRNPKYWENPDKFDPDRFSPENKKKREASTYMPFGIGPRLCIGKNIALMEMQLILILTLRRYKINFLTKETTFKAVLNLAPKEKVMVKLERR
ncbi:MAG: cytochrome P450 [Aureispira sp.]